jgi:hypothetical protein
MTSQRYFYLPAADTATQSGVVCFSTIATAMAVVSLLLLMLVVVLPARSSAKPDNIVVFFADNLGWGDIFGSPSTRTPALDGLARDGIRMLNWYSAAHVCSPSRAALLTGRLMVRTGVYPMTFPNDATNGLPTNETTLAEHLKTKGYRTFMVGSVNCPSAFLPLLFLQDCDKRGRTYAC